MQFPDSSKLCRIQLGQGSGPGGLSRRLELQLVAREVKALFIGHGVCCQPERVYSPAPSPNRGLASKPPGIRRRPQGGQWEIGRWLQGVCGLNDLGRLDRLNGGSAAEGNRDLNLSGIEGTFRILCFNSWEFGEVGQF